MHRAPGRGNGVRCLQLALSGWGSHEALEVQTPFSREPSTPRNSSGEPTSAPTPPPDAGRCQSWGSINLQEIAKYVC